MTNDRVYTEPYTERAGAPNGRAVRVPRVLLAAPSSGSGKTLITCGVLAALKKRGLKVASCKCGPDYIDPMFHTQVLQTPSRNLDTFFTGPETTRYLLARHAVQAHADLAVIEGVMGYYDGLGGRMDEASAYDVARTTDTPVVLIVDARGMSQSVLPLIRGFAQFREDSRIAGVILNRMNAMMYEALKGRIEEMGVTPLGCVPVMKELHLESRHLGLVMPSEIEGLQQQISELAAQLETTLDLDALIELARSAPLLQAGTDPAEGFGITAQCAATVHSADDGHPVKPEKCPDDQPAAGTAPSTGDRRPVIAVARDEAFCFLYEDNLQLLRQLGAQLAFFSPIHDEKAPDADGLLLCGGYPELHLPQLSGNRAMLEDIRGKLEGGTPFLAECGGFMYLMEEMEDVDGRSWPAVGFFEGKAFRTGKLGRFGYIRMHGVSASGQVFGVPYQELGELRGHEFHYFDTTNNGEGFLAEKPAGKRSWQCLHAGRQYLAGFPHMYYYSNVKLAEAFVRACAGRRG